VRTIEVSLAGAAYDVVIGAGALDAAGARIAPLLTRPRAVIVADAAVEAVHGARLRKTLAEAGISNHTILIPPGEEQKSFAGLERLCHDLLALEVERGDLIIAFGGGVVGDLTGFAAAILKRGVDFVQIPTTLLAQVDASVGGKTAIDMPEGKNLIGAFHQPRLVLADLAVLSTLPEREVRCGYAEIVKYGLVGDADFFAWLEVNGREVIARQGEALAHAIARSVEMKAAIVAEDERESGRRALLNLGHTFAHALEAEAGYGQALKHGEAVAVGCALAFRLSARLGLCAAADAERAARAIAAADLPIGLENLPGAPFAADALMARMAQDKKAKGGALTFILARGVGRAFIAPAVEAAAARAFLLAEGARP
jgi:3-dehydroquinate synthase